MEEAWPPASRRLTAALWEEDRRSSMRVATPSDGAERAAGGEVPLGAGAGAALGMSRSMRLICL